jgi:beta-barrel assembly-enhancing protease
MKRIFSSGCWLMAALIIVPASMRPTDQKNDVEAIGSRNVAHKSIISIEKEVAIGRQYAAEIDKSGKLLTDSVVTEYVNRLAQNIARNSDIKVPLTTKVLDLPDINAFALPGGFLYVNSGLLAAAEAEAELAGVISHEVAHVAARHWASQMTKSSILQYAMIPLIFTPMSYPVYVGVSQGLNLAIPLTFLKFSRSAESEADLLGLQYLYKAGYDPNAYVAFFGRMMDEQRRSPESAPSIFLDHPMTGDRIIKSEEAIKGVLPKKASYLVSTSEFDDVRGRLLAAIKVRKLQKSEANKPTLRKREAAKDAPAQGEPPSKEPDKPPVLRRHE